MTTKQLWWLLPLACLAACSNGAKHEYEAKTDSAAPAAAIADSTQALPLNAPERKYIRKADLTCKVSNVMNTVSALEHTVTSLGGMIQESKVYNNTGEVKTIYYKPDSLKEVHPYTTAASLTLKVPTTMLDSVVRSIPAITTFIDTRTLSQTDVTARYAGNEELIKTGTKAYAKEKAVALSKKPDDLIKVQEYEDNNLQQYIDRKVQQAEMKDDVSYATITIALSQPQQVYTQVVVDPEYASRVPFGTRIIHALADSADVLGACLVGLVTILPVLLILFLVVLIFRRSYKKLYRFPSAQ